jgi:hypothetical protein
MSEPRAETTQATGSINGATTSEVEARLRYFFGEQRRLRALLEQTEAEAGLPSLQEVQEKRPGESADRTRADLDRINAELLRFQDEYCTDPSRAEEYDSAIERILGFDPRIDVKEVEEILAGKHACDMKKHIEDLERIAKATPAQDG